MNIELQVGVYIYIDVPGLRPRATCSLGLALPMAMHAIVSVHVHNVVDAFHAQCTTNSVFSCLIMWHN